MPGNAHVITCVPGRLNRRATQRRPIQGSIALLPEQPIEAGTCVREKDWHGRRRRIERADPYQAPSAAAGQNQGSEYALVD